MNRTDWQAWNNPLPMLNWLRERQASERKLRLFACACCRDILDILVGYDPRAVSLLEKCERMADGQPAVAGHPSREPVWLGSEAVQAGSVLAAALQPSAWNAARETVDAVRQLLQARADSRGGSHRAMLGGSWVSSAQRIQAALVRDLFGDPFRSQPLYLADVADQRNVMHLARMIYSERSFQDLPVLADALEDAGCTDEEVLEHCREPGEHARGCWLVDAVLGRS
jgi:hypothetical protein